MAFLSLTCRQLKEQAHVRLSLLVEGNASLERKRGPDRIGSYVEEAIKLRRIQRPQDTPSHRRFSSDDEVDDSVTPDEEDEDAAWDEEPLHEFEREPPQYLAR
jgi:hypothetical protein